LQLLYKFCKIYINNIVIFSKFFTNYFNYLQNLFIKFVKLQITLSFTKIYFNYLSIILFKQKIDVFDLFIIEKQIVAIKII